MSDNRTHWDGCESEHHACALELLAAARADLAALIHDNARLVETNASLATELAAGLARGREEMTKAATDVLAERKRQIEVEGWSAEHDDAHGNQSMSIAAACYALVNAPAIAVQTVQMCELWRWTEWSDQWFKPKDRRSNLVRAAALLLADIERLDRAAIEHLP